MLAWNKKMVEGKDMHNNMESKYIKEKKKNKKLAKQLQMTKNLLQATKTGSQILKSQKLGEQNASQTTYSHTITASQYFYGNINFKSHDIVHPQIIYVV